MRLAPLVALLLVLPAPLSAGPCDGSYMTCRDRAIAAADEYKTAAAAGDRSQMARALNTIRFMEEELQRQAYAAVPPQPSQTGENSTGNQPQSSVKEPAGSLAPSPAGTAPGAVVGGANAALPPRKGPTTEQIYSALAAVRRAKDNAVAAGVNAAKDSPPPGPPMNAVKKDPEGKKRADEEAASLSAQGITAAKLKPGGAGSAGAGASPPPKRTLGASVSAEPKPGEPPNGSPAAPFEDVARLYMDAGYPEDAAKIMDEGVKRAPEDPRALAARARARLASGRREEAVADARRALALDPKNETARLIAGYGDVSGGARSALRKGPAFDPADPGGLLAGGGAGAGSPGGAAGGGPGFQGGAAGAGAARAPSGLALSGPPSPAEPLLQRAAALLGMRDLSGALMAASQAVDGDPKSARARALRAEILNRLGKYDAAIRDADEALRLDPANAQALRARSYANYQLGNYRQAYEDADRAVKLEPQNAMGYLYRAMAEEKLGMSAEALRDYETAVRLDPALETLAEEAIKRLRGSAAAAGRPASPVAKRLLFRGTTLGLALLLILAGLLGTEKGRKLATTAGRWLTGRGARSAEEGSEAAALQTLASGSMLGGHFQIVRELGRGGMGVVYEAEDLALQRRVALKQLRSDERTTRADLERFITEARLVAKLRHPNLAEIHTVIVEPDVFLVFDYVEGLPLDKVLADKKRLGPAETARVLADLCGALDYAHAQKIIHRDLKPSNVMVCSDGTCKIMDFGIAHQSLSGRDETRTAASGTPPYMAPEQVMGSVSKTSDLYALAVMTFELVTGSRPFSGPDYLGEKLESRFPPATRLNPGLPPGLDAFFARALAPEPARRFQSGRDFLEAFSAASKAA